MQNTVAIKLKDMPEIIRENVKAKLTVNFVSSPGIGKTSLVYQTCEADAKAAGLNFVYQPTKEQWEDPKNYCLSVIVLSQVDELDVKGLPNIVENNGDKYTSFTLTDMFPKVGRGVIFFDEAANANQQVMTAMQPIINERIAGNVRISDDIIFVLASNKLTDNSNVKPLPSAMKNRMSTYEVALNDAEEQIKAMAGIGRAYDPKVVAFLLTFQSMLYTFDPSKTSMNGYASPRAWENVSKLISGSDDLRKIQRVVGGWCGQDVGDKMYSFIKLAASVDINDLMNHPEKISMHEDDIGKLYSICITLVDKSLKSKENANKVFRVMDAMSRDEFGLYIFNSMLGEMGKNKLLALARADPKNSKLLIRYSQLFSE